MHLYYRFMDLDSILKGIKNKDRQAQRALYDTYAPVLMSIGMRYMKDVQQAEDMVAEAFFKIFTRIHTYKETGSFEGWMKRIMINECLMEIRKNQRRNLHVSIDEVDLDTDPVALDKLSAEEIISTINELPEGYRTVFNMYVIDGYKHREIADILGISIHTSKSQLIMAKRKLQQLLKKNEEIINHELLEFNTR